MINVLHRGYQVLRQLNSFMKFIPVIFLAIDILSGLGISFFLTEFYNHIEKSEFFYPKEQTIPLLMNSIF